MVRIRLRRMGLKRQPSYRIVVTDSRKARNGAYLEVIGHHNPRTRPTTDIIEDDRALYWLSVGAQPSDAVRTLMKRTGTWDRFLRLQQGESMEKLVEEAKAVEVPVISPKTNYPSPAPGKGKNASTPAATVSDDGGEVEAQEEA